MELKQQKEYIYLWRYETGNRCQLKDRGIYYYTEDKVDNFINSKKHCVYLNIDANEVSFQKIMPYNEKNINNNKIYKSLFYFFESDI